MKRGFWYQDGTLVVQIVEMKDKLWWTRVSDGAGFGVWKKTGHPPFCGFADLKLPSGNIVRVNCLAKEPSNLPIRK